MLSFVIDNWRLLAVAGLILAVVGPRVWDMVKGRLPSIGSLGSLVAGDSDKADMDALKQLRKRKAFMCPECKEALKVLSAHFLDEVAA